MQVQQSFEMFFEQELNAFLKSNKLIHQFPEYVLNDPEHPINNIYTHIYVEREDVIHEDFAPSMVFPLQIHLIHKSHCNPKQCALLKTITRIYEKAIEKRIAPKDYKVHHHEKMSECDQMVDAKKCGKRNNEYIVDSLCTLF